MAKKVKIRVAPTTGDPVKGVSGEETTFKSNRGALDKDFDVRDYLSSLVAAGNQIGGRDKAATFGELAKVIGQDNAAKMMDHIYIFNQNPDIQKMSADDRLRAFYNFRSSNPEIEKVVSRSRALGYGVVPGFRESVNALNQQLTGRLPTDQAAVAPEIKDRIMLKVAR